MQTVRFANVVAKCGEPETHLLLIDPAKDRALQAAIKAERVMTVFQNAVGSKADHGTIGFEPGKERQFLVFPKSLRAFTGKNVVGIKYDLLSPGENPKAERLSVKPQPKSQRKLESKPKERPRPTPPKALLKPKAPKPPPAAPPKETIPFKPAENEPENEEVLELKKQVKHAMAVLEQGKQVAAFNLLKRIVEDR